MLNIVVAPVATMDMMVVVTGVVVPCWLMLVMTLSVGEATDTAPEEVFSCWNLGGGGR